MWENPFGKKPTTNSWNTLFPVNEFTIKFQSATTGIRSQILTNWALQSALGYQSHHSYPMATYIRLLTVHLSKCTNGFKSNRLRRSAFMRNTISHMHHEVGSVHIHIHRQDHLQCPSVYLLDFGSSLLHRPSERPQVYFSDLSKTP